MKLSKLAVAATVAVLSASPALATQNFYETFENFVGGGAAATAFGTDALGTPWVLPFGGGADSGFLDVAGYPDDATSAVQFNSLQNDALQNTQFTENSIGGSTVPYAVSFAMKLNNTGAANGFVQLVAGNSFVTGPGFRTIFQMQVWGEDFLNPGDPSVFVVTPFSPSTNTPQVSLTGVPGILTGANSFDATGATWNVVILIVDPLNTTMRAWVNPTSTGAVPDIQSGSVLMGSSVAPHFLSLGAYTFLSDTTPTTSRTVTIDSLKITSGAADLDALFAEVYGGYSTLASSGVAEWSTY